MQSKMCEMFGIDVPIFAFSHCRDVVVEVSKAGGFGVLGMARMHPDRVEAELSWIDEHIEGKPYGIDVLMPSRFDDVGDPAARTFGRDERLEATAVTARHSVDVAGRDEGRATIWGRRQEAHQLPGVPTSRLFMPLSTVAV